MLDGKILEENPNAKEETLEDEIKEALINEENKNEADMIHSVNTKKDNN